MKFRGIPGCPPFRAAVRMLATCILLGAMAPGMAQEQAPIQTDQAAETRAPDGDPLGRDTPKSSFYGFLKAAEAFDWETAEEYLDLRNLPQKVRTRDGTELAQQFYFILQRRGLEIDGELLSTRQEGQVLDDLPDYRDELARINTMDGEVTLLMQHVPG
ncbi:MAG: hypothetical protein GWM87_09135, partial [Xanthomonadales bacterium]|nr:hypothetical protein [Xanthomonadales bacterium]NIX13074.1 hypothetical protein [Xanthomonadales bacterium]